MVLFLVSFFLLGEPGSFCETVSHQQIDESLRKKTGCRFDGQFAFRYAAGDIAVIEFQGNSDDFAMESADDYNPFLRQALLQAFYEHMGDVFDQVVFMTDFAYFDFVFAFRAAIKNEVEGIGMSTFDLSGQFHSGGRLKGIVELGHCTKYLSGGSILTEDFSVALLHELGHQWLARVGYMKDGQVSAGLLKGDDLNHWSFLLDSDASYMYGNDWVRKNGTAFFSNEVMDRYSNLDLYLMGFLPPEEVGPMTLLHSSHCPDSPDLFPASGIEIPATEEIVSIDQIIAAEGPRDPISRKQPQSFRIAFIFCFHNSDPTPELLGSIRQNLRFVGSLFSEKTLGLGHLDFRQAPLTREMDPFDLDLALSFLESREGPDGWADSPQTLIRDTVEVVRALAHHGYDVSTRLTSLQNHQDVSSDETARIAGILGEFNLDAAPRIDVLKTGQHPDGGFSLRGGYRSNALDTVLALGALIKDPNHNHNPEVLAGIDFLLAHRTENDVWDQAGGTPFETAIVLDFLESQTVLDSPELLDAKTTARNWLYLFQGAHGGFGQTDVDLVTTCFVQSALAASGSVDEDARLLIQRNQSWNGSWNNEVYSTALVLNFLSKLAYADISLLPQDVSFSPPQPIPSSPLFMSAIVRNKGNIPAEDVTLSLYLGLPETGGQLLDSQSVGAPLEPGTPQLLELSWSVPTDLPEIFLVLDATSTTPDIFPGNNRTTFDFSIQGVGPDPVVFWEDFLVSNADPYVGEEVIFNVTVRNIGSQEVSDASLSLFDGDPDAGGLVIGGPEALPALSPFSGEMVLLFSWIATGPEGPRNVVLRIESASDANPDNNTVWKTLNISEPVPGLDIGINPLTAELSPSDFETCPQDFEVSMTLVDHGGTQPQDFFWDIYRGDPATGGNLLTTQTLSFSAPRESLNVLTTLSYATLENFDLFALVRPPAGLVDVRTDNDRYLIPVAGIHLNDLEVLPMSLHTQPDPLLALNEGLLSAEVMNRNVQPRTGVVVEFWVDSGTTPQLIGTRIVDLPGNDSAQVTASWIPPEATANALLTVLVDPQDVIVEIDEDDNAGDTTISVIDDSQANLYVNADSISFSPPPYLEGEGLQVEVSVENRGSVEVSSGAVSIYLDAAGSTLLAPQDNFTLLAAHGVVHIGFDVDPVTFRGSHYVVVEVSTPDPETSTADNMAAKHIHVVGGPNPAVESSSITLVPAWPGDGEPVDVNVRIENRGETIAENLLVELRANADDGTLLGQTTIDLPPGSSTETFSFVADASISQIICILDPQDQIIEMVESDNRAGIGFSIRQGDVGVDQVVFSPNFDGIRDNVTLFWDLPVTEVEVRIVDHRNRIVERWMTQPAMGSVLWEGRQDDGTAHPDGFYLFQILDPESGFILRDRAVSLDNNLLTLRDALDTHQPGFFNLLEDDVWTGDTWLGWTDDSSSILAGMNSGPVIAVSPDGQTSNELMGNEPEAFSLSGFPGRYFVKTDMWNGTYQYDLVGLDLQVYAGVVLPSEIKVQDWVTSDTLLVFDTNALILSLYDFVLDNWTAVESADHVWQDVMAAFRFGQRIWVLEGHEATSPKMSGLPSVRSERILSFDLAGHDQKVELDVGALNRGGFSQSIVRHGPYWALATHESLGGPCQDIIFLDLNDGQIVFWRDLYSVGSPDPQDIYSDGRLHRSPIDLGDPQLAVLVDWNTGESYVLFHDTLEILDGLISPDDSRVLTEWVPERGIFTSYQNLAAVFEPIAQGNGSVLLQGTVADRNLHNWHFDQASIGQPDVWIPTGISGTQKIVNRHIATWIPSAAGEYLVRLTAMDEGGNARSQTEYVQVQQELPFFDLVTSPFAISPNQDGIQDSVTLSFEVRNAFEAILRVFDPSGINKRVVTTYFGSAGPGSMTWDGRDEFGQTVHDGTYRLDLNGTTHYVMVDTSMPVIQLHFDPPTRQKIEADDRPELHVISPYWLSVDDGSLTQWSLERRRVGESEWILVRSGVNPYESHPSHPDFQLTWQEAFQQEFRLVAVDAAGNQSSLTLTPQIEYDVWTLDGNTQSPWTSPGENLSTLAYGAIPNLSFEALLPENRFPLDLTAIEYSLDGATFESLTEFPAASRWFLGPQISPQVAEYVLPAGELIYRFVFTDAQTQVHRTENLGQNPLRFDVNPVVSGEQGVFQFQIAGAGAASQFSVEGQLLGLIEYPGGPILELAHSISLDYLNWVNASCGIVEVLEDYRGPIAWKTQPPLVLGDTSVFVIDDVVLFPDGTNQTRLGRVFTSNICTGDAISFVPHWECRNQTPDSWTFSIEIGVDVPLEIATGTVIRFFADRDTTIPISSDVHLNQSNFELDLSPCLGEGDFEVFARVFDLAGSSLIFYRLPGGTQSLSAIRIEDQTVSYDWVRSLGFLHLTQSPIDVVFDDQFLCPATEDELNAYDPETAPILRRLSYQITRDPPIPEPTREDPELPIAGITAWPVGFPSQSVSLLPPTGASFGLPNIDIGRLDESLNWMVEIQLVNQSAICQSAFAEIGFSLTSSGQGGGLEINTSSPSCQLACSPNGDETCEQVILPFWVEFPSTVTAWIEPVGQAGQSIRVLWPGVPTSPGSYFLHWDGQNDHGVLVADGRYRCILSASTPCATSIRDSVMVRVDTQSPTVAIQSPTAGTVDVPVQVFLSASDNFSLANLKVEIAPSSQPNDKTIVQSTDFPPNLDNEPFCFLNMVQAGSFELTSIAEDRVGNLAITSITIDVVPNPLIGSFSSTETWISANNDGRHDGTLLSFELFDAAIVDLTVQGQVTVDLLTDAALDAGTNQVFFDGTHGGSPIPNGTYDVELVADNGIPQAAHLTVKSDVTPPQLQILEPEDHGVVDIDAIPVSISISEPYLMGSWTLEFEPSGGLREVVATGTEEVNGECGEISGIVEGANLVFVSAMDAAGNTASESSLFFRDRTPPALNVTEPVSGQTFGVGDSLHVQGTFVELFPEGLVLELVRQPDGEPTLLEEFEAAQLTSASFAHMSDLSGFPEGEYVLRVTMQDQVAHQAVKNIPVFLNQSPPVVFIDSFAGGGFLTAPVSIQGTADDLCLDHYVLSVAPIMDGVIGGFIEFFRGFVVVSNSELYFWSVLPADGAYRLRLEASDCAGQNSLFETDVVIDQNPPPPPQNLTALITQHGTPPDRTSRVNLTWDPVTSPDLAGYQVFRNQVLMTPENLTGTSFVDDPVIDGSWSYSAKSVDLAGNHSSSSDGLNILLDTTAPTPQIFSPISGSSVGGVVQISGSVFDQALAVWSLSVGAGTQPTNWTLLATSNENVSFGVLGEWVTSSFPEGAYLILLQASDQFGNQGETSIEVQVENQPPQKPAPPTIQETATSLRVSWTANPEPDIDHYRIYRNGAFIDTEDVIVYFDRNLPDGSYFYQIMAVDHAGNRSPISDASDPYYLDRHPPHMSWVTPENGLRFDADLNLEVTTADQDLLSVLFQFRVSGESTWTDILTDGAAPWNAAWSTGSLSDGDYDLRAVATDQNAQADPSPTVIMVTKGDIDPPAAVDVTSVAIQGHQVTIQWNPGPEGDLQLYRVYRDQLLAGEVAVPMTTFEESDVPIGQWTYCVTALDTSDNEGPSGSAEELVVFSPDLIVSPDFVDSLPVTVEGTVRAGYETVDAECDATIIASTAANPDGSFVMDLPLPDVGANQVSITAHHPNGDSSVAATVTLILTELPDPVSGLTGWGDGAIPENVVLEWAEPLSAFSGYTIDRSGAALQPLAGLDPLSIANLTTSSSPGSVAFLMDGDLQTAWVPDAQPVQEIQALLIEPRAITDFVIDWDTTRPLPNRVAWWAEVHGTWVRIWQLDVPLTLTLDSRLLVDPPRPVVSLAWKLVFETDQAPFGIAELSFVEQPFLAQGTTQFIDSDPGIGLHEYSVSSLNLYGRRSEDPPATTVGIGDYEPPDPPTDLSAVLQATSVLLSWTPSPSTDVVHHNLIRNGQLRASIAIPGTSFLDENLHSGTYLYEATAVDGSGNQSTSSNSVSVTVEQGIANPPLLTGYVDQSSGTVWLAWTYDLNTLNFHTFRAYRRLQYEPDFHLISSLAEEPWHELFFNDTSVPESGKVYEYRVAAVDTSDLEVPSNTIVVEYPLHPPVFFAPGLPNTTVTVHRDSGNLMGWSEPGTKVRIFKDSFFLDQVDVASSIQEIDPLSFPQQPFDLAVDTERRWLAISSAVDHSVHIFDLIQGSEHTITINHFAFDLQFDPFGVFLAFIDRAEASEEGQLKMVDLRDTSLFEFPNLGLVKGPLIWLEPNTVALGQNDTLSRFDIDQRELVALQTRTLGLTQVIRDPVSQRLLVNWGDPTTTEIWSVSQHPPEDALLLIDSDPDTSVFWAPERQLLFLAHSDGQIETLFVPLDHVITTPVIDNLGLIDPFSAVVGVTPDGRYLAILEPSGLSKLYEASNRELEYIGTIGPEAGVWASDFSSNGTLWLAHFVSGEFDVCGYSFAGFFTASFQDIDVGVNQFSCVAYDPNTSVTSRSSASLTVDYSLAHLPDLQANQLTLIPSVIQEGQTIVAQLLMSNLGGSEASDIFVAWELTLPDGSRYSPAPDSYVASLAEGAMVSVGISLDTMGLPVGPYSLSAAIDPNHLIAESDENNNDTCAECYLVEPGGLDIAVQVDPAELEPQTDATISATIYNASGSLHNVSLAGTVETETGEVAAALDPVFVGELGQLSSHTELWTWDSRGYLAGGYRVRIRIEDAGSVLAEQFGEFDLLGDPAFGLTWLMVPSQVATPENLEATVQVENQSTNVVFDQAQWVAELSDPNNTIVQTQFDVLPSLIPGAICDISLLFQTGQLLHDTYTLRVSAWHDGAQYQLIERFIDIDHTPLYSAGVSLFVSPLRALVGAAIDAEVSIRNDGNQSLDLEVQADFDQQMETRTFDTLATQTWTVAGLEPQTTISHTFVFSTGDFAAGKYRIRTHNDTQASPPVTFSQSAALELSSDNPPVLVINGLPDRQYTEDDVTPIIEVIDEDDPLPVPAISLNGQPFVSGTVITVEGAYTLTASVEDRYGQRDQRIETFGIDRTPPTIEIFGLEDGGQYSPMVLPNAVVSDLSPFSKSMMLDGGPYSPGTPITEIGTHQFQVNAADALRHTAQRVLNFEVIPQGLTLAQWNGIAHGVSYSTPVTVDVTLFQDSILSRFEINGASETPPFQLTDEGNYFCYARAESGSGLEIQDLYAMISLDFSAPVITIRGVCDGSHYDHSVYPVILIDGQPADPAQVSLNGQPFSSGSEVSTEAFYTLTAQATDPAGNQSTRSIQFVLDFTAPLILVSGVQDGQTYTEPVIASWQVTDNWLDVQEATLNGAPVTSPLEIRMSANYVLQITGSDRAGNFSMERIVLTMDGETPLIFVSGVRDGDVVRGPVTIVFNALDDNLVSLAATLDGYSFTSGENISAEGPHTLEIVAEDADANISTETVAFALDRTPPLVNISGVEHGQTYSSQATPVIQITEAHPRSSEVLLDTIPFVSGTPVTGLGNHNLSVDVVDQAGNETTAIVVFSITETGAPEITITGVSESEHYPITVYPEYSVSGTDITSETALINGQPFSSGDPVADEASYLLTVQVEDLAGHVVVQRVNFVVDKTAPVVRILGIHDGSTYRRPVVPEFQISDLWLESVDLRLDGFPYTENTPIDTNGPHIMSAQASDRAGNQTQEQIGFILDIRGEMTLEPESLYFGNAMPTGLVVKDAFVFNHSFEALDLTAWQIDGPDADLFDLVPPPSTTVPRESHLSLTLSYAPTEEGHHQATLSIDTSSVETPHLSLAMSGVLWPSDLDLGSPMLSFSPTRLGNQSRQDLAVDNLSDTTRQIEELEVAQRPDIFSCLTQMPVTIPSRQPIVLELGFAPDRTGPFRDTLSISSDDPLIPQQNLPICGTGYRDLPITAIPRSSNEPIVDLFADPNATGLFFSTGRSTYDWNGGDPQVCLDLGSNAFVDGYWMVAGAGFSFVYGKPTGVFVVTSSASPPTQITCSAPIRAAALNAAVLIFLDDQGEMWQTDRLGDLQGISCTSSLAGISDIAFDGTSSEIILAEPDEHRLLRLPVTGGDTTVWVDDPLLANVSHVIWTPERTLAACATDFIEIASGGTVSVLHQIAAPIEALAVDQDGIFYTLADDPTLYHATRNPPFQTVSAVWTNPALCAHVGTAVAETGELLLNRPHAGELSVWNPNSGALTSMLIDPVLAEVTQLAQKEPGVFLALTDAGQLHRIDRNPAPTISLLGDTGLTGVVDLLADSQESFALTADALYSVSSTGAPTFLVALPGDAVDMEFHPANGEIIRIAEATGPAIWEVDRFGSSLTQVFSLTVVPESISSLSSDEIWVQTQGSIVSVTAASETLVAGPYPSRTGKFVSRSEVWQTAFLLDDRARDIFSLVPKGELIHRWREPDIPRFMDDDGNLTVLDLILMFDAARHDTIDPLQGAAGKGGRHE